MPTINIPSAQNGCFADRVPVGLNGAIAHIPLDQDTEVSEEGLAALNDSEVKYFVIGGEGSTAAASVGVTPVAAYPKVANEVDPAALGQESPVLAEGAPTPALGGDAPALVAAIEATGLADTNSAGFKPADGAQPPAPADASTDEDGASDESQDEEGGEPEYDLAVLDNSLPELSNALESITDPAHLDALTKAEQNGKTRTGAFAAIDARKAALAGE